MEKESISTLMERDIKEIFHKGLSMVTESFSTYPAISMKASGLKTPNKEEDK